MVMGRSYKAGRTLGRVGLDSSMRMTNKAEVGFGLVGVIVMGIIVLVIIGVFL